MYFTEEVKRVGLNNKGFNMRCIYTYIRVADFLYAIGNKKEVLMTTLVLTYLLCCIISLPFASCNTTSFRLVPHGPVLDGWVSSDHYI